MCGLLISLSWVLLSGSTWHGCSVSSESGACISGNMSVKLSWNLVVGCMLSVKESVRFEGSVSTYAAASVGSAASVRLMRLDSGVSVLSGSRVGTSVSVLGTTRLRELSSSLGK